MRKLKAGETQRSVAGEFNVSQFSVHKLWIKFRETESIKIAKRPVRPYKVTIREKHMFYRGCLNEPFSSPSALYNNCNIDNKLSSCKVRTFLISDRLFSITFAKKPLLSKTNITKKQWCKNYSVFQPEDWNKIVFSDETKLEVVTTRRRLVRN